MRLLYEHNGVTLEIEAAIQNDPLGVRGLLIKAWLVCERALPDSADVLQAERGLREAISQFRGGDHITRYLLKGKLEPGISANKAELIQSSLRIGGLLALIGVFYGTAYNTTGGRKVLGCLTQISDESKVDLFKRARSFPMHTPVRALANHILGQLGHDIVGMACLLYCLGTKELSRWTLTACRSPSKTWGENGEVFEVTPNHITPMLQDQHYEHALNELEAIGLVRLSRDLIRVDTQWANLLDSRPEALAWKVQSIWILSHVFPKYKAIDAAMYRQCEQLLPNLKHAFSYLSDPQVMDHLVRGPRFYGIVETCLASSYFQDQRWKEITLAWADHLLQASGTESNGKTLWSAWLAVRKRQVSRLYSANHIPNDQWSAFPRFDQRSNGFAAELVITNAQELIRRNELDAADQELSRFIPYLNQKMSTFEESQLIKINRTYGVLRRFQGRFNEAYDILNKLPHVDSIVISHFAAVLSERKEDGKAITKLEGWLQLATQSLKAGTRVKHMLTQVTLVRAMRPVLHGQSPDAPLFRSIRDMYQEFRENYHLYWFDHICTWVGIAICSHLGDEIEQGIQAWQEVRCLTRQQNLPIGHTDAIVAYSLSELEMRRGEYVESEIYAVKARSLIAISGQHFILGMGVWIAILDGLFRKQGRLPITTSHT
ncbi:hypothetical protein F5X99DRAFT_424106 [Biscogniauxia marginata]|nr:hypothetical protein F5X99DRAFT_424106 [Biscogniauxia marginata]